MPDVDPSGEAEEGGARGADPRGASQDAGNKRKGAPEADALGLGDTTVGEVAADGSLDITGTPTAILVTGVELAARTGRKAREEFRAQTNALRERLNAGVQRQLEAELAAAVNSMREAITPYNNFVQPELNRMQMAGSILGKLGGGGVAIRGVVESTSL